MMVNLGGSFKPLVYNYQYDQLNRLVAMDSYKELNAIRGLNQAINQWDTLVNTGEYKERIAYDANGNILKYLRQGYGSNLNMDSLTYNYNQGTNQLNYIRDQVNGSSTAYKNNYTTDLEDQSQNNYSYDEIGNLTKDGINLSNIKWSVYGKILHMDVRPVVIGDATAMDFFYDPQGNRIGKSANHYQTPPSYLWYVRDAQGNVLAVYQIQNNPDFSAGPLKLIEQDIYGSSRLGVIQRNMDADHPRVDSVNANLIGGTYLYSLQRGVRNYELSNHLGNVLTTITDQRKGIDTTGDGVIDYYMPVVVSSQDYYPFGMQMPGRTISSGSYRYGFNGKEKDSEVKGEGNQYDYGMRIYDPRVGKFLSIDPLYKKYPELTPYQFASNNPIESIDLDGAESQSSKQTNNNPSSTQIGRPALLKFLDDALTGGALQTDKKINMLDAGIRNEKREILRYRTLKNQAFDDLLNTKLGSTEAKFYSEKFDGYSREEDKHTEGLRLLIKERYKDIGDIKANENYNKAFDLEMRQLYFGFNVMSTAASFIPGPSSMSGFFLSKTEIAAEAFSLRGGYGLFGKTGLRIGSYEINAMYRTPSVYGTGTIFSVKQMVREGNLLRLDYGKLHLAEEIGAHWTYRFKILGTKFGGSKVQIPWHVPFTAGKY